MHDLLARQKAATGRGVGVLHPVFAGRARNAEVWDVEGGRLVDFAGGIAVLATGHGHPRVIAAVTEQLGLFHHTCYHVLPYELYVRLAERLNALAPIDGPVKTNFFTTGAEAVENAVKVARAATQRDAVIAFSGSFHGRTHMGMSLTGKVASYKRQFGQMVPSIYHVPFPVEHHGVTVEDSLRAIEHIFAADIAPNRVAAIIIEPVQGEGGFHAAPHALLRALRALCDREGIVLIVDEVQTGFGRTGKMFAVEHSGCRPDLMAVAKSLAGGFPLSAMIGRADLLDAVEPGGLGGTYAASPIACAAALAVLDIIEDEQLVARARRIGARLQDRIAAFVGRGDLETIAQVRGQGAMVAFDLVPDDGPPASLVADVLRRGREKGLILVSAGVRGETIRLLPPLTIGDAVLDEGLDLLEAALRREER